LPETTLPKSVFKCADTRSRDHESWMKIRLCIMTPLNWMKIKIWIVRSSSKSRDSQMRDSSNPICLGT